MRPKQNATAVSRKVFVFLVKGADTASSVWFTSLKADVISGLCD